MRDHEQQPITKPRLRKKSKKSHPQHTPLTKTSAQPPQSKTQQKSTHTAKSHTRTTAVSTTQPAPVPQQPEPTPPQPHASPSQYPPTPQCSPATTVQPQQPLPQTFQARSRHTPHQSPTPTPPPASTPATRLPQCKNFPGVDRVGGARIPIARSLRSSRPARARASFSPVSPLRRVPVAET